MHSGRSKVTRRTVGRDIPTTNQSFRVCKVNPCDPEGRNNLVCNVDSQDIEGKFVENDPMFAVTSQHPREREPASFENTTRQREILLERRRTRNHNQLCSGLVSTRGETHRGEDVDRRPVPVCVRWNLKQSGPLFVCAVIEQNFEEERTWKRPAKAPTSATNPETHDEVARDDVNNATMDPAQVREARKAEMEHLKKMQVYKKVPVQQCKDATGKMPIKVRWIDTNEQHEVNPKYRSRLVAKEFKRHNDPDLFSSIPPIGIAEMHRQQSCKCKVKKRANPEHHGK